MEIKEFQELVKRTANTKVSGEMQLFDYTLGLVGEAGEVADCIKKAIFHQVVMDKKTKEEMGDLLWYIASLCNSYGWKIEDLLDANIAKLDKRYPNGFVKGGGYKMNGLDVEELMIQLTYKCNAKCIHCSYGDLEKNSNLDVETIRNFLRKYPNPKLIKLSGGEPTLSPIWNEVVSLCKDTGAKVVSFTNGSNNPKTDVDAYWVSLYGTEFWHKQITKNLEFDRVISFIKYHNVEYLCSPIFTYEQIIALKYISEVLKIPPRITLLQSHGLAKEFAYPIDMQRAIIESLGLEQYTTCSLGFQKSKCSKKMCLKPDGSTIMCTAVIRGNVCAFIGE